MLLSILTTEAPFSKEFQWMQRLKTAQGFNNNYRFITQSQKSHYTIPSMSCGILQKCGQKEWWENLCTLLSSGQDTTFHSWTHTSYGWFCWVCTRTSWSAVRKSLGRDSSLVSYWLWMDSRRQRGIAFDCQPTGELMTRLTSEYFQTNVHRHGPVCMGHTYRRPWHWEKDL